MAAGNPVCRVPSPAQKEAAGQSIPRPAVSHLNAALPSTTGASVSRAANDAAACFPTAPAWTPDEVDMFLCRRATFVRRQLDAEEAERLAEVLVLRDRDCDDRRVCVECSHLQRDGGCYAARQGWMPGVARNYTPMRAHLQRCDAFTEVVL